MYSIPLGVSTTATTTVASSATVVPILAANPRALIRAVFNESTAVLYLKYGTAASATSYTTQVAAGGFYAFPPGPIYTGDVTGLWASANGNARVTEG